MTEKDIIAKLAAHEKSISGIVDKHRAAAAKLQSELSAAETVLTSFETLPTEAGVAAALAAEATADSARKLIGRLGPVESGEVALRDAYVAQNSAEVLRLLESLHDVRTVPRAAFREALGKKIGELEGRAAVEEDVAKYQTMQGQIEELEKKLGVPTFTLAAAGEALRTLKQTSSYAAYANSKDAILRIEFPSV